MSKRQRDGGYEALTVIRLFLLLIVLFPAGWAVWQIINSAATVLTLIAIAHGLVLGAIILTGMQMAADNQERMKSASRKVIDRREPEAPVQAAPKSAASKPRELLPGEKKYIERVQQEMSDEERREESERRKRIEAEKQMFLRREELIRARARSRAMIETKQGEQVKK